MCVLAEGGGRNGGADVRPAGITAAAAATLAAPNMDGIAPQAESMIPIASCSASCWLLIVRHRFYRLFDELSTRRDQRIRTERATRTVSKFELPSVGVL